MKKIILILGTVVFLIPRNAQASSASKAAKIIQQMNETLGTSSLASARYLRFDLQANADNKVYLRSHAWDRQMGEYRLEWTQNDGSHVIALFNIESGNGSVFVDGHPMEDKALAALLAAARHYYVNDSYWLLAPFRLNDPGTRAEWLQRVKLGDQSEDVIVITVTKGGPDAGSRFWLYVNRKTHRPDRWAFPTAGAPNALESASPWSWDEWKSYGDGVWLAQSRICLDQQKVIRFPVLGIFEHIDNIVFEDHTAHMPNQSMPVHAD